MDHSPKAIDIAEYDYALPAERVAKFPLERRDQSRLLVFDGQFRDEAFERLDQFLPAGSLLVFNDAKVVRARLEFHKPTGGRVEVFLLEPHEPPTHEQAFAAQEQVVFRCLVGNLKKWKGERLARRLELADGGEVALEAEHLGAWGTAQLVRLRWDGPASFAQVVEQAGQVPIPPYLDRESQAVDDERYQTLYARREGSVAAPTAGLHFTPAVFERLHLRGVRRETLSLHVGAGTFRPVKSERLDGHEMHAERFAAPRRLLEALLAGQGPVVAVGTTSLRALESLYWMGCKLLLDQPEPFFLGQWEPYQLQPLPARQALEALLGHMGRHGLDELPATTQVIIGPGYALRVAQGLVTNFHQPRSTLLVLVAALLGQRWKELYQFALDNGYRFLSYGDSSLLWDPAQSRGMEFENTKK